VLKKVSLEGEFTLFANECKGRERMKRSKEIESEKVISDEKTCLWRGNKD
jgi:hypothetical protein